MIDAPSKALMPLNVSSNLTVGYLFNISTGRVSAMIGINAVVDE
jgi:hypothetical protein